MPKITELPGKQEKGDMRMSEFKVIETQEELDAIIKNRLERVKEKYSDYDDIKALVVQVQDENSSLKSALETSKQETESSNKQIADLEAKISGYETENLRTRIALQNGLPFDLADRLQGTDEESLKADAERLASFIKPVEPVAPMRVVEPQIGDNKTSQMKSMLRELNNTGE